MYLFGVQNAAESTVSNIKSPSFEPTNKKTKSNCDIKQQKLSRI